MKMIDRYQRILEPEGTKNLCDMQKINHLTSKMTRVLNKQTVNIEICKCTDCGSYRGVGYV